jgi:DNA-binding XRE family transcriptional regulator
MIKINTNKLAQMDTANEMLDEKYGKMGSTSRDEFEAKAKAWYYAEVLKDARKKAGITQQQMADRIGKKREYVSLIEKGKTDMQLSTFLLMTEAVGLKVVLL